MSFTPAIRVKKIVNKNRYKYRWLLPLLFLFGYLITYSKLNRFEIEYLVMTCTIIINCCLLLTRLRPPFKKKLPICLIFAIFIVAYYLKFYLYLIIGPKVLGEGYVQRKLYYLLQYPTVLNDAFNTISYAFIIFCITAWLLIGKVKYRQLEIFKANINYRSVVLLMQWFIPIIIAITAYGMYTTKIGRMGAANTYLPFRLAGWIYHIQTTFIPSLILLFILYADKIGLRIYFTFGVILLFFHSVSDMVLRSSRGSILFNFILLFLLFLVTATITKKRLRLFGVVFIITIVLFPFITAYRDLRLSDLSMPITSTLYHSITNILFNKSFSYTEILTDASFFFIFRLTGADSLIHIMGSNFAPLYFSAFGVSIEKIYTIDVLGFPPKAIHSSAPSFLGWFYIVGGNVFVMLSTFVFTIFIWIFWCILARLKLHCLPVAQALLLMLILTLFSEGALSGLYIMILVMAGSIAACEWIVCSNRGIKGF
jgi:hypothetical protein